MNLIGLYGPCRVSQGHSAIGGASATPTPRGIVYRPDLRLVVSNCKQVDQTGPFTCFDCFKDRRGCQADACLLQRRDSKEGLNKIPSK